jgi:hypothetical protein
LWPRSGKKSSLNRSEILDVPERDESEIPDVPKRSGAEVYETYMRSVYAPILYVICVESRDI